MHPGSKEAVNQTANRKEIRGWSVRVSLTVHLQASPVAGLQIPRTVESDGSSPKWSWKLNTKVVVDRNLLNVANQDVWKDINEFRARFT